MKRYEITGLNIHNVINQAAKSKILMDPTPIPETVIAGLDENTIIAFTLMNSSTVSMNISTSNQELSEEAASRLTEFTSSLSYYGFELTELE